VIQCQFNVTNSSEPVPTGLVYIRRLSGHNGCVQC